MIQKITENQTGLQCSDLLYANDKENEASIAAVAATVPATAPSKNLFNPATPPVQIDKYVNTSGNIATSTGWACSGFIPVTPGLPYTLSSNKDRIGIGFYDAAKATLRYRGANTETFTPLAGEVFVVFNLYSPTENTYTWAQLEQSAAATEYVPFGRVVPPSSVEGLAEVIAESATNTSDIKDITDAIKIEQVSLGTNLANPKEFALKALLNNLNGALITGSPTTDQYDTSGFVPVSPATLYTILNNKGAYYARKICYFNAAKVYISGADTDVLTFNSFTTPALTAFVRISVPNELYSVNPGIFKPQFYGIFLGASPVWAPYGYTDVTLVDTSQETADKADDNLATIGDVKALNAQDVSDSTDKIDYTLAANLFTARTGLNSITGQVGNSRGYTGNNMFNFNSYVQNGVSASNGDDVAPTHQQNNTLGANHGWPAWAATIAGHGLNNTAIGKLWTKGGVNWYVVRIIDANTLHVLSANSGTPTSPIFATLTTGVLTGTPNLTITAVASLQIYPSIKNLTQKVLKNGLDPVTAGAGAANFVDVVESYEIMNVNDILNNIIARANTSPDPVYTGAATIRVENVYRFLPNNAVVILVSVRALQAVAFADIMATQAILVGTNGVTQYYVPNSLPIGALDFRTPTAVMWSGSIATTYLVVAAQADPTNPPNRVIQYFNNTGFMVAYLKTRGVGKALQNYTDRTFELRNNTGKIYPHPIEGTKIGNPIPVNYIQNVAMVRCFTNLAETRIGNRLSCFNFNYEGAEYVYLDYSGSVVDRVDLKRSALNGKAITVVEIKNAVLNTDTYNDGLYITATYVAGETCYAVLLIQ